MMRLEVTVPGPDGAPLWATVATAGDLTAASLAARMLAQDGLRLGPREVLPVQEARVTDRGEVLYLVRNASVQPEWERRAHATAQAGRPLDRFTAAAWERAREDGNRNSVARVTA